MALAARGSSADPLIGFDFAFVNDIRDQPADNKAVFAGPAMADVGYHPVAANRERNGFAGSDEYMRYQSHSIAGEVVDLGGNYLRRWEHAHVHGQAVRNRIAGKIAVVSVRARNCMRPHGLLLFGRYRFGLEIRHVGRYLSTVRLTPVAVPSNEAENLYR